MMVRTGIGYDVHAFQEGLPFIIGGITVESPWGAIAHSDGDVLIHALCDALLGAAALGDIGQLFPDTDLDYKGRDSAYFLREVCALLRRKQYAISNVDCSVVLQKPKIASYIPAMRQRLAEIMQIDVDQVSVKATTSEKLGFTGRSEGVAAYAISTIILS